MSLSRRNWLWSAGAAGSGFYGLRRLQEYITRQNRISELRAWGYGPLVSDRRGLLDLPADFAYQIIGRRGMIMEDGLRLPGYPDGMNAFPGPDGLTLLIRNHELMPDRIGPWGTDKSLFTRELSKRVYDRGRLQTPGCGGTTTVVYDTQQQKVVRQFLSLAGTWKNCAGGPTPWNSWISCEETVERAGVHDSRGGSRYFAERDHGYNFEVPARSTPYLTPAEPLKAMGRFRHEAVAVDEKSGIVFQTEDRADGLFYRFLPKLPGNLRAGGRLQALAVGNQPAADTRNWDQTLTPFEAGKPYPTTWVDLPDIDSPNDDLRHRGRKLGAAVFARGEGAWATPGAVYFACTSGGAKMKGQIWRYLTSAFEGTDGEAGQSGHLELFVEANMSELLDSVDNITMSPWGDLFACEDNGYLSRIVGVTAAGTTYTFAHHHTYSEFTGLTFSPDGSTLFVNAQQAGLTLAITGPWTPAAP